MRLEYGDGKLQTQQGVTADGLRCLCVRNIETAMPINSKPSNWAKETPESEIDCVLAFKNLAGARTLQDELNELIAVWSREEGKTV
jgi:hypothetical protein